MQGQELMTSTTFASEIAAVLSPGALHSGLPNACYVDDQAARIEAERIFADQWACIGFAKDIPRPGDIFPVDLAGSPLLMLRHTDNSVRVFHNACRHRGVMLAEKPGNCRGVIRCPYHSWCYDLDGRLRRTPHVGGPGVDEHPEFDRSNYGLLPVRSEVWMGLVFVNLSGAAPDFDSHVAPLAARWASFAGARLYHTGPDATITFTLEANWKLAVENYCEAYHLPWVHPALNSYSRLEDHYNIVEDGLFAGQGSRVYSPMLSEEGRAFPPLQGLAPEWAAGAEYIALFPNVLLGVHKDHFYAVVLLPDGPHRVHERMEIFYFTEEAAGLDFADLRAANQRTWRTVFAEDVGVVEAMHKGRRSRGFDGGVLTPVMDHPTYCFHAWAAQALLAGTEPASAVA